MNATRRITVVGLVAMVAVVVVALVLAGCGSDQEKDDAAKQPGPRTTESKKNESDAKKVPPKEYGEPYEGLSLAVDWESVAFNNDFTELSISLSIKNVEDHAIWIPVGLAESPRFVKAYFFDTTGERLPFEDVASDYTLLNRRDDFMELPPGEEISGRAMLKVEGWHLGQLGQPIVHAEFWVQSVEIGLGPELSAWTGTVKSEKAELPLMGGVAAIEDASGVRYEIVVSPARVKASAESVDVYHLLWNHTTKTVAIPTVGVHFDGELFRVSDGKRVYTPAFVDSLPGPTREDYAQIPPGSGLAIGAETFYLGPAIGGKSKPGLKYRLEYSLWIPRYPKDAPSSAWSGNVRAEAEFEVIE